MSTEGVKSRGLDGHWDEDEIEHVPNGAEVNAVWKESEFQTFHVKMRDGVEIAVDVILPPEGRFDRSRGLPILFHQTRYWRSITTRKCLRGLNFFSDKPFDFINSPVKRQAVAQGFAVVSLDARGTGASGGTWAHPWSPAERADSLEVLCWALKRPWSDGRAVLFGMSYDATAALHTAAFGHPGVIGLVLRYPFWDLYDDISFPGGVPLKSFTTNWSKFNSNLDSRRLGLAACCFRHTPVMVQECSPLSPEECTKARGEFASYYSIPASERKALRKDSRARVEQLSKGRQNWRHTVDLDVVRFADDPAPSSGGNPFYAGSPCVFADRLACQELEVYVETGWLDVTVNASLAVFNCAGKGPLSEMIVGPWSHGGMIAQHEGDGLKPRWRSFPHLKSIGRFLRRCAEAHPPSKDRHIGTAEAEAMVRWMETYPASGCAGAPPVPRPKRDLAEAGVLKALLSRFRSAPARPDTRRVMAFTMGPREECRWMAVSPDSNLQGRSERHTLFLSCSQAPEGSGLLLSHCPHHDCSLRHDPRRAKSARGVDRISSIALPFMKIKQRGRLGGRNYEAFSSPPLHTSIHVLGSPLLSLWIIVPCKDTALHVMLLDEDPRTGSLCYVTEGAFRALHRRSHPRPPRGDPRAAAWVPGRPFHSFSRADASPLEEGAPALVEFALLPCSYVFPEGHSVRLAVAGADRRHYATGLQDEVARSDAREGGGGEGRAKEGGRPAPCPWMDLLSGPTHPSRLALPCA